MSARAARSAIVLIAAVLVPLGGCSSAAQFESEAGRTAQDGVSEIRTALVAVRAGSDGKLADAYLVTVLEDAEDALSSAQESFRALQPPEDVGAERLRAELSALLARGVDGVSRLRIAASRGDLQQAAGTDEELGTVADALERLEQEYPS
jgi:hypothetical protein